MFLLVLENVGPLPNEPLESHLIRTSISGGVI